MLRFAAGLLWVCLGTALGQDASAPYSFKGNVLGMTLIQFRDNNNALGSVWINTGKPNFMGRSDPKKSIQVFLPLCTDRFRGFPGDSAVLEQDEVLCNVDPHDAYSEALMVGGKPIVSAIYRFYRDRLYRIQLVFSRDRLGEMELLFRQKYGAQLHEPREVTDGLYERAEWGRGSQSIVMLADGPVASALFLDTSLAPKAKPLDF